ncbi:MAG: hypothetical protein PHD95_03905 [Candidatus ainarchaeum sp.]|nr:hypothetical protein [Candidatus ainarchaeum sp.]
MRSKRAELEAKLIGKAAVGEKVAEQVKNPAIQKEILFLAQQLFLPREELKKIRSAIASGKIRGPMCLALVQGHRLFQLAQQEPEMVRPLAQAFFRRKGNSSQTRSMLIHFIEYILRNPGNPHVFEIEDPLYPEQWVVALTAQGHWTAKRRRKIGEN